MSDANQVAISYEIESTWGTDPDDTSQKINFTSESLKGETGSTRSASIRDDRQTPDIIRNSLRANGDINVEWQIDAYDDLLEGLLMADTGFDSETTVISAATTVSFTQTTTISTTGTWTSEPDDGDWIVVQTASGVNDGYYKVASALSNSITITAGSVSTEGAGQLVTIKALSAETQGTTAKYFYIRRSYLDLNADGDVAAGYPGMMVDGWNLSVGADAVVTGGFSFLGQKEESLTDGPDNGFTAASTDPIINGIDHVKKVRLGAYDLDAVGFTLNMKNNLRERLKIGTLGAYSIGMGTVEVSGTITAYFDNSNTLAAVGAHLNWADPAAYFALEDGTSGMVIEIPNVKITSAPRVVSGINTDVMAELAFEAFVGPSGNAETIRICKGSAS